jgi:membrane-bound metal-dependent hydrolase YbcI (DUF457 family)
MFFTHLTFALLAVCMLSFPLFPALIAFHLPDMLDKALWLFGLTDGRSFPHSWMVLAPFLIWLALGKKNRLALVFVVGILSHLALDVLNTPGIPFFYPFGGYFDLGFFQEVKLYPSNILLGSGPWFLASEKIIAAEALSLFACIPLSYLIIKRRKKVRAE